MVFKVEVNNQNYYIDISDLPNVPSVKQKNSYQERIKIYM